MAVSPAAAALSILIPINIERTLNAPDSPASIDSLQSIQSDDENDREVVEKRLSRYYPETPVKEVGAPIVRPQFSCPDFGMGTARTLKGRMKEAPPVPSIPTVHFDTRVSPARGLELPSRNEDGNPSPRPRIRKKNSFVQLDANKRTWEDSFGKEQLPARKRHGMFFGRLQGNLEPPNPHRRSRFLTSFDDLFKPELPSSKPYPFREGDEDSLRDKIRQGMEDSIIPSVDVTPVKGIKERVPLKERIKTILNTEKPRRMRRRGWFERIVGKKVQKI